MHNLFELSAQDSDLAYFFELHRTFCQKATFNVCSVQVQTALSSIAQLKKSLEANLCTNRIRVSVQGVKSLGGLLHVYAEV